MSMLIFLLSLLLLLKQSTANPQLSITIPDFAVTYFNLTFEVTSSYGLPLITCSIICGDIPPSSVTYQMTTSVAYVPVPVPAPAYIGTCSAGVSADYYDPVSQDIFVYNYTQCQQFDYRGDSVPLNKTSNATYPANYTLPGPLGYIFIDSYQVVVDQDVPFPYILGQVSKDSNSLIFFQNDCAVLTSCNMQIIDPASYELSKCENYGGFNTFYPYTPFYDIYWSQAQGIYNFTTFLSPEALNSAQAEVQLATQICLAANYIVADAPSYFVPGSVLTFNASLGLSQSMSAAAAANLTCGNLKTRSTFNLTSDSRAFTLETPDAVPGEQCTLYIYNDPEVNAYAAPINVLLTVDSLLITVATITVNAGDSLAYNISVQSDPETEVPVSVILYCSNVVTGGKVTFTSNVTQYFTIPNTAVGICQFNSTGSNTVDITVNQQLNITSSLTGWKSGSSVPVNISSPSLEDVQILLTTTCPVGIFEANVMTATDETYPIPSNINGIQCMLTSSNLPPFYLPIPVTYVTIAVGEELSQQIVQQISPASFIEASNQPESNQKGLLKVYQRFKRALQSGIR